MNTREKNKQEMLGTVSGFYEEYKNSFTGLTGLITAFTDVISIKKEIELNERIVNEGTKGKVVSRDDSHEGLITSALTFAGALYGYAASKNDLELLTFADISSSTFTRMRIAEIPLRVEDILDKVDELGDTLSPFGVTAEQRTAGRVILNDYFKKFGGVNSGKGSKKSASESSKKLLTKADTKLKVLDKLMFKFSTSNSDLYSKYETARMIYDKKGTHNGGSGTPPTPPEEPK